MIWIDKAIPQGGGGGHGPGCVNTIQGLGFGVWVLGFGVRGAGFRVRGLGFGVWGLGCEVQNLSDPIAQKVGEEAGLRARV